MAQISDTIQIYRNEVGNTRIRASLVPGNVISGRTACTGSSQCGLKHRGKYEADVCG
jgi:hypothetical protein